MLGANLPKFVLLSTFFLILLSVYLAIAIPYYSGDDKNHIAWAKSIINEGSLGLYQRQIPGFYIPNYPPLTMWAFLASLMAYGIIQQIVGILNNVVPAFPSDLVPFFQWENIEFVFIKLAPILANIFLAFGLYYLLPYIKKGVSQKDKLQVAGLFLFNIPVFYVSAIWGQVDYIPLAFFIWGLYFLYKPQIWWSAVMVALGLLSKQTVLIFLPIYLFLVYKKFSWSGLVKSLAVIAVSFWIAFWPFTGLDFLKPFETYWQTIGTAYSSVGENTLNFWGALFNFKSSVPDSWLFLFLTYQQLGIVLFILLLIIPGIVYLKNLISGKKLIEFLFIISLTYFFFVTRLHERHLAPALVFAPILVVLDKRYWPVFIYLSFLNLLNLYRGSFQPNIELFNNLLNSLETLKILVIGYFLVIVYSIYLMVKGEKND